ncbi:MAG: hypothetical protein KatS3mg131_0594 [Candidatus Tectimicrobiota bacterium]|nr:MAG: hypothetical protein KatS3mg131_0594 [Candidatus Tectomicrobia bacterium]
MQFPIAKAHMAVEAADLMPAQGGGAVRRRLAVRRRGQHGQVPGGPRPPGKRPNACLDCHGGYGFAAEYDVERKFRETRLYKTAPVNNTLVLAYVGQHVLGMPRSY